MVRGPDDDPVAEAWTALVDALAKGGEEIRALADAGVAGHRLDRADAHRSLLRAVHNQLGRTEVDRGRPDLVPFNGWRSKFLMDNPDFSYWVADIADDVRYRIVGSVGRAVFTSITAYAATGVADAAATARIDSDALPIDADGRFELTVGPDDPTDPPTLVVPDGARALWVRMFHDHDHGAGHDARDGGDRTGDADAGWCHIEPIDAVPAPSLDHGRLAHQIRRAATAVSLWPRIVGASTAPDWEHPNEVRHWAEMTGGAAFTEPGIHYVRGSWVLEPDEALVIEGVLPSCRYWNVLLYSPFLNSLDHRHRRVSRAPSSSTVVDGRYRYVLAPHDPLGDPALGARSADHLDTEGRRAGIFVLRFLGADAPPELPSVARVRLGAVQAP